MESVTGVFKVFSSLIFGLLFFFLFRMEKMTKVAPLSHFFFKNENNTRNRQPQLKNNAKELKSPIEL